MILIDLFWNCDVLMNEILGFCLVLMLLFGGFEYYMLCVWGSVGYFWYL